MALVSGVLTVHGAEAGRVEVAQEGRPVSECVVAAKASIMALVNAEIAKAEGGAAAADADKGARTVAARTLAARGCGCARAATCVRVCVVCARAGAADALCTNVAGADAPDVYEDNAESDGEEAKDAALLKLPQKRKQKHRGGGGDGHGGQAGKPAPAAAAAAGGADAAAAPMQQ
jgi:hypothetical protein